MNSIDILVPDLPESVTGAVISSWHKKVGDSVQRNEKLIDIETDKVILEIPAPASGILDIFLREKEIVNAQQVLGRIFFSKKDVENEVKIFKDQDPILLEHIDNIELKENLEEKNNILSPSMRRFISGHNLKIEDIENSNIKGFFTKDKIKEYISKKEYTNMSEKIPILKKNREEKRVPMSCLRKCIAKRLIETKNNIAMLTTFNEVNMKPILDLRKKYGKTFEERHNVRLGLMSFYVKTVLEALKRYPKINAYIDGEDIIYHNFFDISIAISTDRGLVTPVLKDVDLLSMADIEKKIKQFSNKGNIGKLKFEELTGGNFTICNGGIFGSLMSTPIVNPPQSAILGIHAIKDRVIVVHEQMIILPMMYLALSYDHRLIDGKESVGFLVTVKEILENPIRIILDV